MTPNAPGLAVHHDHTDDQAPPHWARSLVVTTGAADISALAAHVEVRTTVVSL